MKIIPYLCNMVKFEFRHFQRTDLNGDPIYYDGSDVKNIFPSSTPPAGFNGTYQDFTKYVLNKEIVITYERGNDQKTSPIKKELSEDLIIVGPAFEFVKDWLFNRPYSLQNVVQVRLTDTTCNQVIDEMIIKPAKQEFCLSGGCEMTVPLETYDKLSLCLERFAIGDGMTGQYRKYCYAVEQRPAYTTALYYTLAAIIFIPAFSITTSLLPLIVLLQALGINPSFVPTLGDYIDFMQEILGLGRCHAAASVAEYILNSADRCGYDIDYDANIFFQATLDTPQGAVANPYVNLDILFAEAIQGKKKDDPDGRLLQPENLPLWSMTELLNKLAVWSASKWYFGPNGLRFIPIKLYQETIFDFRQWDICEKTEQGTLIDICVKGGALPPVSKVYSWAQDQIDIVGNDARPRYGARETMDVNELNPNFTGETAVDIPFGAARFRDDGIRKDYLDEAFNNPGVFLGIFGFFLLIAVQFVLATGIGLGTVTNPAGGAIMAVLIPLLVILLGSAAAYFGGGLWATNIFNGVLVMSQNVCAYPKLLLWDGADADDAKVVVTPNFPAPNLLHNTDTYPDAHPYNKETIKLRNYPVFTDPRFLDNAHSYFHAWNDVRNYNAVDDEFTLKAVLCCEILNLLGVYQSQIRAIDMLIEFDYEGTDKTGAIEKIQVNFTTKEVEIFGFIR